MDLSSEKTSVMEWKLSFNTKPESNGVPTHDVLKNRWPYLSIKQSHIAASGRPGKQWMDLKMDEHLEEIVLMNLNRSFH